MWVGLVVYAAAALLLILTPEGNLPLVVLYVFAARWQRRSSTRAKMRLCSSTSTRRSAPGINALVMASTIACSSPFGYFAGWLSSVDRRLPFAFAFLLFALAMGILSRIQEPRLAEGGEEA